MSAGAAARGQPVPVDPLGAVGFLVALRVVAEAWIARDGELERAAVRRVLEHWLARRRHG